MQKKIFGVSFINFYFASIGIFIYRAMNFWYNYVNGIGITHHMDGFFPTHRKP